MWVKRPRFGAWGDLRMAQVRQRFRSDLVDILQGDSRIHDDAITEYTLQSIIFDHASWLLGRRWRVLVEDFIPRTNLKADLVIERLNQDGFPDLSCGVIAAEVKPRGGAALLGPDITKLKKYVNRASNDVNCGILFYLSQRQTDPAVLRRKIGRDDRNVSVSWIRRLGAY